MAECLYRNNSSGIYYALVKKAGKQIRRSLRTTDRKFAERRLADFRRQVTQLKEGSGDKRVTFKELSKAWLLAKSGGGKERTSRRRENSVKQLSRYFGPLSIREINAKHCEVWNLKRGDLIAAETFNDLQASDTS